MTKQTMTETKRLPLRLTMLASALLLALASGHANEPFSSYPALVDGSLKYHPQVQAAQADLDAALAQTQATKGRLLPSIDLTLNSGFEHDYSDDTDQFNRLQLTASQLIYDGLNTPRQIRAVSHQALASYYQLRNTQEQVALDSILAHENLIRSQQLLVIAQQSHELHRRVLSQVRNRVNAGAAPRIELEQISGRMALAESNLLIERSNLQDAMQQYLRVTGRLPGEAPANIIHPWSVEANQQSTEDKLFRHYPQLLASFQFYQSSTLLTQAERSRHQPSVVLRANHLLESNSRNDHQMAQESRIELAVNYGLFNGGSKRANVADRLGQEMGQWQRHLDLCFELRRETRQQVNELSRLQNQLTHLQQHQQSSERIRQAYRNQFDLGQRTLLEVLDAESEYLTASRALSNGEQDLTMTKARLSRLQGDLLQQLNLPQATVPEALRRLQTQEGPVCQLEQQQTLFINTDQRIFDDLPDLTAPPIPEPSAAPEPVSAPALPEPMQVFSSSTSFELGSAELSAEGEAFLRTVANQIRQLSQLEAVTISGHTDNTGTDRLNRLLSQQRAESAQAYLVSLGIDASAIRALGLAADNPIASNDTPLGRQQNRRIEVEIRGR